MGRCIDHPQKRDLRCSRSVTVMVASAQAAAPKHDMGGRVHEMGCISSSCFHMLLRLLF